MSFPLPIATEPAGALAHLDRTGTGHLLCDHLRATAELAANFAGRFGAADWIAPAALCHDLGKYPAAFQGRLRRAAADQPADRVDHSSAGAQLLVERYGLAGRALAYLAAGHHSGLADWQSPEAGRSGLALRLAERQHLVAVEAAIGTVPTMAGPTSRIRPGTPLAHSLWLRLLFSCLVDADRLDTERFFQPAASAGRTAQPTIAELAACYTAFMASKQALAEGSPLAAVRKNINEQALAAATGKPGLYTLSAPTGSGKTLATAGFALRHASTHGKRRIIYVIPYTSIIEQTANEFRAIFDAQHPGAVLEHHANLDIDDPARCNQTTQLATENWDAPLVVTTAVQFFESLFASQAGRCRKLHNIVDSVVVLDEAQLLPPDFLQPILMAIDELRRNYGVTFLLATATQPALTPQRTFDLDFAGLSGATEILTDPGGLARQMSRATVELHHGLAPQSWEQIATEACRHESALVIVNRRRDARRLWQLMPAGTFHLSALMCGAHRSQVIDAIRARLDRGLPTQVVSTQLIECGVDLSFPVVLRALAGLDSIAQAAGRCNRHGELAQGRVLVFATPEPPPAGAQREAAAIARTLLREPGCDPLHPDTLRRYFSELFWQRGHRLDRHDIVGLLQNDAELRFSFRTAADKFQIVASGERPVIVGWHNDQLLRELAGGPPDRLLLRRLQRSIVTLPAKLHERLLAAGALTEPHPGVYVQAAPELYDASLGLDAESWLPTAAAPAVAA